jgi:hypothetical protein
MFPTHRCRDLLQPTANGKDQRAEPIELCDDDRRLMLARGLQGLGELRPAIKCVGTVACLDLFERLNKIVTFRTCEPWQRRLLGFEP